MESVKKKSIFKNKNFVLTALGAVESNIGAIFYNFFVSFYILSLTNNNSAIQGLYLGITGLFFVLASPIGGVIVDKFNKAKILYVCDFLRSFVILATVVSIMLIDNNTLIIIILFIGGVIGNIIGAIFAPAGSSLIPEIVGVEDLQTANSISGITTALQTIIGTTLVGFLYNALSTNVILFIVSGFYFLSGVTELFIKYDYKKKESQLSLRIVFKDMKDTFSYIKTQRSIFILLCLLIFLNLFFNPIQTNFFSYFCVTDVASNNYLLSKICAPEIWQSIFCVALSVASILMSLIFANIKIRNYFKAIKKGFLIISLAVIVMTISYFVFVRKTANLNVFLVINTIMCLLIGAGVVSINVPIASTLQEKVDITKYGKVMSLIQIGAQGLTPVMTLIAGLILLSGSEYLLLVLSIGLILTTLIALFSKKLKEHK